MIPLLRTAFALAVAGGMALSGLQAAHAGTISNSPPVDENLPGVQACYGIGASPINDPCAPLPIEQSENFDYTDVDGDIDYGTGSGSVTIIGGDDPSVSVTAASVNAVSARASGYLWYAFEITAPADVDEVPILLTGTDSVSGSIVGDDGGSSSTAQILVCPTSFSPDDDPVTNSLCSNPVYSTDDLTNISDEMELSPGDVYYVELYAEVDTGGYAAGNAYVDPTFSIDLPPDTPGYSIAYGPGLFPTTSAPEPGSLAVLSSGILGLLGVAALRKRIVPAIEV